MKRKIAFCKSSNLEVLEEIEYENIVSDEFLDREAFMFSLEYDTGVVWLDVTDPYAYQNGSVA